ncbi:RNA 3'-terminal phosphate cyclase [Methanobacterium alcaliphilum]|uniref:RNA 3'-terminal phosphate cyclase n=1 Tax=Methanobacterium alcaliphilum TaxID=392018 RepID=UPI00200A4930|nr:RNA 3'-terminal phosphate cyclase [Methanobacterium alcaliphilum]MCK9151305.1 RNA 3'-terminal phosphate cyclase [Methanobacterium alcaliphilum]
MIELDGSFGEGGGALIRISVALSALSKQPLRIFNIRANRPKKGLAAQHLTAVKSVAELCDASIQGLEIGSTEIVFSPGNLKGGSYDLNIKTAGSISLVLQAFMIPAAFASSPVNISVRGGTDVRWSPPINYLQKVMLPVLEKMGYYMNIDLVTRGHYPRGSGLVKASIKPVTKLKSIELLEMEIDSIKGISHSVNLPRHVAERQAKSAEKILSRNGWDVDIEIEHSDDSISPGSGIFLWTEGNTPLGGSSIGEPGKIAEKVGQEAAMMLLNFLNAQAPLDKYMGDQIIPYMAIAGDSLINVAEYTLHAHTNIHIVETLTGKKFKVMGKLGEKSIISCK